MAAEVNKQEAALSLFKAMRVYPSPKELMSLYDKTVPKVSPRSGFAELTYG